MRGIAERIFRAFLPLVVFFNLALALVLLLRPLSSAALQATDDVAQGVGPLVAALAAVIYLVHRRAPAGTSRAARLAPFLLAADAAGFGIGQSIYTYLETVRHVAPFPSLADVCFVFAALSGVAGILLLPIPRLGLVSRLRVLLNALLFLAAASTISWYYVLGPTVLGATDSTLARAVGSAYPVLDLLFLACYLPLAGHLRVPELRTPITLLGLGMVSVVVSDSLFDYGQLHGTYHTGMLVDVGWPLGYMLLCAAGVRMRGIAPDALRGRADNVLAGSTSARSRSRGLGVDLFPYLSLPALGLVLYYAAHRGGDGLVEPGVWVGAGISLVLVLVRQAVVLWENGGLYARLDRAYRASVHHGRVTDELNVRLREGEERYRTLVNAAPDGVLLTDARGGILMANRRVARILGLGSAEELIGTDCLSYLVAEDRDRARGDLGRFLSDERLEGQEYRCVRADGTIFPAELRGSLVRDARHRAVAVTLVLRDLTERQAIEARLRHQALHDGLTDLPNRTLLHDRLEHGVQGARRSGAPLALLLMDLDRFKEVNDTFGHHLGDLLLRQVAQRLRECLRESDTVARLGGDEFAVLLPNVDGEAAARAASRLVHTLEHPFEIEGQSLAIGTSIGIALYPEHGEDGSTLLRRADVAMYMAKRTGIGHALYASEQDDNSPARLLLTSDLRRSIDRGGLELHYQPMVDLRSGAVTGVEALVRWNHPTQGMVPPDRFIPLAEHTGLIRPLCLWTLRNALERHRAFARAGFDLPVAINLSTRNLQDDGIVTVVRELLVDNGVDPGSLMLEVTESAIMSDPERSCRVLEKVHEMGVRLAIDDFGTGYSSLSYLKRLPVDAIKIDRSFIAEMAVNEHDHSIARAVIDLGHNLGLRVVAEGVEDLATWNALRALGCDEAQGYYLSRPLSASAALSWLHAGEQVAAGN